MELIPTPLLAPGTCYFTGQTGPVVDTGKSVDWFPANAPRDRIYISVDTVRELAQVAGIENRPSVREAAFEAEVYNRGYMDAVKERVGEQLVELVDRLGLLAALLGADDDVPVADDAAAVEGEGPAGDGDVVALDAEPGVGGSSDRPRRVRRRADVPGNPAA